MAFAREFAAIFVSYDEGLMMLTTSALRLYNLSSLVSGFNIFAAAFFAALNNGRVSSILSLTRTLVFQLGWLFLLPMLIGQNGIWLSVAAAELFALAVALRFTIRNRK